VNQAITVPELARAIHTEWRSVRERDGWRLGPPDVVGRTSPYLKSIDAFSDLEWRRERWLALTDLLAIAAHSPAGLDTVEFPLSTVSRLQAPQRSHDINAIARRTHAAWVTINRMLGIADANASRPFDTLDDRAKNRSRANVACDIAAIAALTRDLALAPLRIVACPDMIADKLVGTAVLAAVAATNAQR
jgi:hypothetical protein